MTPQLMHTLQIAASQNPILDSHLRRARRHQMALDEALAAAVIDLVRANDYLQAELVDLMGQLEHSSQPRPAS
ncbi:MAG: hypothetical protein RBS88_10260 [Spongiibacteraceae bacterium]|jgi:hypothetical protein|nr:hypothetical protein [Spongiibacteraceae bacterium]